ncbi:MAG: sugar O-acetyltransferase, partial [Bacteroidales bacterium]|nr:sugar O-acetyltransferase [Bacteroidales bacterium]
MKTEKEKMLAGELYFSADADLTADRERCKDLCHEYNVLRPSNTARQQEIIKKLFGKVGENCFLTAPFWCDYGYNMEVGENFYSNHNCVFLDCAKITFGNNVFVAP